MKRLIFLAMMMFVSLPVFAAPVAPPVRVYVAEFNVVGGGQNKDETKVALQTLLASRIGTEKLLSVSSVAEAEVVVTGTYVAIGRQYNIDTVAKSAAGQTVARTFVQGEGGQEALFAAVGSLAEKISAELITKADAGGIPRVPMQMLLPSQPVKPGSGDIIRSAVPGKSGDLQYMPQGDLIRPQAFYRGAPNKGDIKRLDAMYNLLALAGTSEDGKRLLYMAQDRSVQLYREGESRPLTGFTLDVGNKILGIDAVDADGNGTPELYVTVMNMGELVSQVWEYKNGKMSRIVDKVPYFFRAIALAGGPIKLYAQEQGKGEEQFFGDVYEITRQGKKFIRNRKIPMPRFGNVYGFNQIKLETGEFLTLVFHEHNYLIVYDKELKELWRSNDQFGGSELFYQIEDLDRFRYAGDKYRWYFMNQRIQVTSKQEVLVGKNDGFFVLGNARMYKKGAVYSLYWNGAALEEVWRTKDTQNYMPDYYFDEPKSELLLLQLTQREDVLMGHKGATALQVKKVE